MRNHLAVPLALALFLLPSCGDRGSSTAGGSPGVASVERSAWETARQNAASFKTALAAYRVSGESTRLPEGPAAFQELVSLLSDYALPRTMQEAGFADFSYQGLGGDDYLITITVGNQGRDVLTVTPLAVTPADWPGGR